MKQTATQTETIDVTVENHGSIFLFRPHTAAGHEWLAEHTDLDTIWYGGALPVEHRYARDLAQGMTEDGLVVR